MCRESGNQTASDESGGEGGQMQTEAKGNTDEREI